MTPIILTTLNARYIHSAFALRYLYANLGVLQNQCQIIEFGIQQRPVDLVEQLLAQQPRIIGFSVYVWNVEPISHMLALLKQIAPHIVIVLGGPEVSHPPDLPALCELADYVITGPGERRFAELCQAVLADNPPADKIQSGIPVDLAELQLPYAYYNDEDIRHRITYIEASRGCPFQCSFCLSALDASSKAFDLPRLLTELDTMHQRGARHFKFIDRTFNLKTTHSVVILEFFLARLSDDLHLHFEVIPDHLPEALKAAIALFPPGVLQFEVGIQSFDETVQGLINRRQNNAKAAENLQWLRQHSHAHLHVDLILGLPGDNLNSIADSFDRLVALNPHEIQVGILKRLRGAPIIALTDEFDLRFDPQPPYTLLSHRDLDFNTMQRLSRFARFWDLIGNSGRFAQTLPLILANQPFVRFLQLSEALFAATGSTWQIALKRLFELLHQVLINDLVLDADAVNAALIADYQLSGEKSPPKFMQREQHDKNAKNSGLNRRQKIHSANT